MLLSVLAATLAVGFLVTVAAVAATLNVSLTVNGGLTTRTDSFTADSCLTTGPTTLAAAKAGTLSTRTDANTGVITVAAGHGITTSDKVAVGWTDASGNLTCRFYMTVSATTSTTISVDGGAGTDFPALNSEVTVGVVTNEFFHLEPDEDGVDLGKPTTAFTFSVAAQGQQAACFLANATDVGGGTLTNGHLMVANGAQLPAVRWGGLGGWDGFDADVDKVYLAPLSTTAPVVTAQSLYNT